MPLTRRLPPSASPSTPRLGEVSLDFDARQKRRQVLTTEHRTLRLELDRLDTPLRDGDLLDGDDGHVVVRARPEPLLSCRGERLPLMRAAYHLGNRHAKVEVRDGELRTPDDPVMGAMLAQLGLEVGRIEAPFDPEVGAYHHHGPGHHHDEAHHLGHGPGKIHRFVLKP
jgi:urease accessory protein